MKFFIVALFFMTQIGCSTIMKEKWEEIQINSTPPGAKVNVSNGKVCHTPCHLELERGKSVNLEIGKNGYQSEKISVSGKSLDGWLWGNLVFLIGLPIAVAVDFYTGYSYDFSPDNIELELKKL